MRNYDRSPVTDDPSQFEVADPPRGDARKRRDDEANHPDQPRDEGKPDEPGHRDKDKDGFQQPRHPQGEDAEVDRRHTGRGNLYGGAVW